MPEGNNTSEVVCGLVRRERHAVGRSCGRLRDRGLSELYEGLVGWRAPTAADVHDQSRCVFTARRGDATAALRGDRGRARPRLGVAAAGGVEVQFCAGAGWVAGCARRATASSRTQRGSGGGRRLLKGRRGSTTGRRAREALGSLEPPPRGTARSNGRATLDFVAAPGGGASPSTLARGREGAGTHQRRAGRPSRARHGRRGGGGGAGSARRSRARRCARSARRPGGPDGRAPADYDFTHPTAVIDQKRGTADALGARQRMEYPARVTLGAYDAGSHVYGESDVRQLAATRRGGGGSRRSPSTGGAT